MLPSPVNLLVIGNKTGTGRDKSFPLLNMQQQGWSYIHLAEIRRGADTFGPPCSVQSVVPSRLVRNFWTTLYNVNFCLKTGFLKPKLTNLIDHIPDLTVFPFPNALATPSPVPALGAVGQSGASAIPGEGPEGTGSARTKTTMQRMVPGSGVREGRATKRKVSGNQNKLC